MPFVRYRHRRQTHRTSPTPSECETAWPRGQLQVTNRASPIHPIRSRHLQLVSALVKQGVRTRLQPGPQDIEVLLEAGSMLPARSLPPAKPRVVFLGADLCRWLDVSSGLYLVCRPCWPECLLMTPWHHSALKRLATCCGSLPIIDDATNQRR